MKCDSLCTAHPVSEPEREEQCQRDREGDEEHALGQGLLTRVKSSSTQHSLRGASLTHKSTGLSACGESTEALRRHTADRIFYFAKWQ